MSVRRLLALAGALALTAPLAAAQGGTYAVTGTNPDGGGRYTGSMDVARTGDTFQVTWHTGGPAVTGVGLRRGDVFAVAYGPAACGVVAYAEADGGYEALWAVQGGRTLGTERAEGADGRYRVAGTNPGSDDVYTGTLAMGGRGDVALFHWEVGGQAYDGLGLAEGGVYGVAYGDPACGVAVYRVRPDGTLDGRWAIDASGAGTETATPR